MPTEQRRPKRLRKETKHGRSRLPLLIAAVVIAAVALMAAAFGSGDPTTTPAPTATPVPTATPTPAPTLTPTPKPVMDFSQPVAENEAVEMDYFADAVFIGDSRTDGFQLYSGIKGADVLCYNGIMVTEIDTKKVIKTENGKVTIPEALSWKQYKKVYISLGINELGYGGTTDYENAYRAFIDQVQTIQPDAIVYVQTLPPVNPEVGKKYNMAYYITNEKINAYNEVLHRLAEEKKVALVDVYTCLVDENGLLPAEHAADGVHMQKAGYRVWLDYLMRHTVNEEEYWNGRMAGTEV